MGIGAWRGAVWVIGAWRGAVWVIGAWRGAVWVIGAWRGVVWVIGPCLDDWRLPYKQRGAVWVKIRR